MTRSIQTRATGLALIIFLGIVGVHCSGAVKLGLDDETIDALGGGNNDSSSTCTSTGQLTAGQELEAHDGDTYARRATVSQSSGCADSDSSDGSVDSSGDTGSSSSSGSGSSGTSSTGSSTGDSGDQTPYLLGTFSKSNQGTYVCPDWPTNMRVYTQYDLVTFVNIDSSIITFGQIYEDDSITMSMPYLDEYGRPTLELLCVCSYFSGYAPQSSLACDCDLDGYWCSLNYTEVM